MIRIVSLAAATATAAMLLTPTVGRAEQPGYYAAIPAAAPAKASLVTRDTLWSCTGGTCVAPKAGERPEVMCERVAKSVGKLTAFTAGGEALDADALDKCNAKAK
ncbi:hypothetical protein EAH87_07610 [Sphingomonas koreensis]|nr:hypothetical protein EAH87_07610 [Sphingomonas koreensis]